MEGLRQAIDDYPLPSTPPLELFQESFSVMVQFEFEPTFTGTTAEFTVSTTNTNSSNLSIVKREDTGTVVDDVVASISVSNELAPVLEGEEDPRIVFLMYTSVAPFAEREEFVINATLLPGSRVVMEARLSGGRTVSDIEDVVTISFPKSEVVSSNY